MIVSTISEKVDKMDAESLQSVTIKDEPGMTLGSSRAYSITSEPPAYHKGTSSSVKIARLIAVTVVAVALILGAAIIAAAYIQSVNNNKNSSPSTETNVGTTISKIQELPSAGHLTGEEEDHSNKLLDQDDSSSEDDETKDHRRLDTEPDLLEEFLENEGKILRLPTGLEDTSSDMDIDIEALTKMFMARNPIDKSKCFVERKPIAASPASDLIRTLPITAKNASAVPLFPIVSGERISIICSSNDEDEDQENDSDIIPARPIIMPIFGMRPQPSAMDSLLGPSFHVNPFNRFSSGPVPAMMMPPPSFRSIRPPPPFGVSPPWMNVNNDFAEQRSANNFLNAPPPFLRPAFPQQQSQPQRPIRFPVELPAGQQFQQFPSPFQHRTPIVPDNSQEKAHVPEQRVNIAPVVPQQQQQRQHPHQQQPAQAHPIFRPPQPNNFPVPDLPESLIRLLEDLPDLDQPMIKPVTPAVRIASPPPMIRLARPLDIHNPHPSTPQQSVVSSSTASPRIAHLPARPVNVPFIQVPIRPPPESERRQQQPGPSFFERLIDSLLGVGNNNRREDNNNNKPMDSMPMETRVTQRPTPPLSAIRTGSRAMREPMDVPAGVVVARPIETDDQQPVVVAVAPAIGEDRVARSHLIQPRSVETN